MEKQVLIFANRAEKSRVEQIADLAASYSPVIVEDERRSISLPAGAQQITHQELFAKVFTQSPSFSATVVIDASWNIEFNSLIPLLQEAMESSVDGVLTFPVSKNGAIQFSQEITTDSIVKMFHERQAWPVGVAVIGAEVSAMIEPTANCSQLIGQAITLALSNEFGVRIGSQPLEIKAGAEWLGNLSKSELSSLLKFAVGRLNIEEIFPNHAWQTHQEESAAACYHTLAALFIKFNDLDAAKECLAFGDQLEDSPRSLALKGLIALVEGETLTAVANMVSSLQEYEKRKKSTSVHYLAFQPNDLEKINTSLQSGLTALNERDNDLAMKHFTTAVFNFDQFYLDLGLS